MSYILPTNYNKLIPQQRREVRLQYIKEQNNKCFYCGEDLHKPPPVKITSLLMTK